jgi:DNA-binding MarR family transcriptional regulator
MRTQTRKVDPIEVAQSCACFNLRKAARAVTQIYEAALEPSGLKATQISVLVALAIRDSTPLTRLAQSMVMDRTTLTRNLAPLKRKGWIAIERGPDRRERYASLTRSGRAVLERALPLWHAVQSRVAAEFGGGRLAALVGELNAVIGAAQTGAAGKRR